MKKGKTVREWIQENRGKHETRAECIKACAAQCKVNVSTARRAMIKQEQKGGATPKPKKPADDGSAGIEGFKELHDADRRQERRDEHVKAQIQKFISGPLKKRGWYYDQEAARVAGVNTTDWSRHRDSYSRLHVMVRTDTSKDRKLVWCDPDKVEEYRDIAERS